MPYATMPGHWLFGNFTQFQENPLALFSTARNYGDMVRLRFVYSYNYLLLHPDLIHEVLVAKAASVSKDRFIKNSLGVFIGQGLTMNEGESWKRQRKLIQPAFHAQRIARYADMMVQHTQAMITHWQNNNVHDIGQDMIRLTSGITSQTLFGTDISHEAKNIMALMDELQLLFRERTQTPAYPLWLPTDHNRRVKALTTKIDALVLGMVKARRISGEIDRGDLLSMLLMAQDDDGSGMDERQVRDETVTLFLAGNDTTYNALLWVWYLLSQNPAAEAKLQAELAAVLGGRLPTMADLPRLPYLEMIIKETLRLYPSAWAFVREATSDVEIGGMTFHKGATFTVSPYATHHDPRFFPQPEKFMPERFSAENEPTIPKYAYFPFGGGPRVCIGNAFAMMEMKLIVATIAQHFTLALASGHRVELEAYISLRPKYGMKMVVQERLNEKQPQPILV